MLATLSFSATGSQALLDPRNVRVASAEELREAFRAARDRALSLDLSALNRMLRLDRRRRHLELQAATSWSSLASYLCEHYGAGNASTRVEALPGLIGDAVARNDAGPDGVPVSAHVEAITMVLADGDLRRADRQTNSGLFRLALGGHGLIGVLYSVTLRVDSLLQSAANAEPPVILDLSPVASTGVGRRSAEFLVPPTELDAALAELREVAAKHRVELHGIAVRKLRPESETILRWASREWASLRLIFSMRPTLGASVHAAEIEREFLDCVLRHGGSFPLDASQLATLAQFEACYPSLREFLSAKRRFDPANRLENGWYRRLAAMLRSEWPAVQASAGAEYSTCTFSAASHSASSPSSRSSGTTRQSSPSTTSQLPAPLR